jgi:hypothetical protein
LNNEANPRNNVNDLVTSSYPKWYSFRERVVHVNYTGDQTLILYDNTDIPCEETEQEHDDVFVQGKVTVFTGGVPANEIPVRFDYRKMHCDGHWGSVDPVNGETGTDGVYVANMLGSFHLDNTQDYILIRATVGGQVQEKIYPFEVFNGLDGSSIFFPMLAEFTFHF